MAIMAPKNKGFDREVPTADQHVAVLTGIWDLGKQEVIYSGEVSMSHQVMLYFELDQKITKGELAGNNLRINNRYTFTLNSKGNLRGVVEAILGRELATEEIDTFDMETLLGLSCMLDVKHTPSKKDSSIIYANIKQISKLPKQLTAFNPDHIYGEETPDWVKEIQKKSVQEESEEMPKVD